MRTWLRRLRGAIGMGLTWAAGWTPIGAVVGLVTGVALGFPLGVVAVNYAAMFGALGFIGGTVFSTIVRLADGRRRFAELSLPRFGAWGATGGIALGGFAVGINLVGLGGISVLTVAVVGAIGLLGAASAVGTLAVARRAAGSELLTADREAREIRLGEASRRELLAGEDRA